MCGLARDAYEYVCMAADSDTELSYSDTISDV